VLAPDADTAARVAVAMHDAAGDFRAVGAAGLTLGVGVHYGPVIQEGGDVFGDAVNLAARLVEQAASGEILLAEETAAALSAPYRTLARSLYSIPVKGRSEEVALCELTWRGDQSATFMPLSPPKTRRGRLTLLYRGAQVVLQHGPDSLTIGREEGCGLVLASEHASRHHCTIQQRQDHFVLTDKSTNGTFVTVEGEGEQRLQHDQLTLRRRGWISFGSPRNGENEAAEFKCD
jgi:adenylate cyclase